MCPGKVLKHAFTSLGAFHESFRTRLNKNQTTLLSQHRKQVNIFTIRYEKNEGGESMTGIDFLGPNLANIFSSPF